jgi:rhodanese-related sulfurtransferase
MPLNEITREQTKATEKMKPEAVQLLDYRDTHHYATSRYHASEIMLRVQSDAYYFSVSKS